MAENLLGLSNAQQAKEAYGAATFKGGPGSHADARKYAAEVTNDWAMALYNANLEQAQWLRNTQYNSPENEYARLLAIGMSPLLAMKAVAGEGSQTSAGTGLGTGSVSARAGSGSEQAAASRISSAVGAAGNLASAVGNFADARLKSVQADVMPDQVQTQQDLMRAEAYLHRQNANWVPRIAESSSNANDARAKYDAAAAGTQKEVQRLTGVQADFQAKQMSWYDRQAEAELKRTYQEVKNMVQEIKESVSRVAYNKSGIALNSALRGLYNSQNFLTRAQLVSQKLDNMYKQAGVNPSMVGAALISDMRANDMFTTLGEWKHGVKFSEDNPMFNAYQNLTQQNFDAMLSGLAVDKKANAQWWINNIYGGINAAASAASSIGTFNLGRGALGRIPANQKSPYGPGNWIKYKDGTVRRSIGDLLVPVP